MNNISMSTVNAAKAVINTFEIESKDKEKTTNLIILLDIVSAPIRWYQISNEAEIESIYTEIRKNDELIDFVLVATSKFNLLLGRFEDDYYNERIINFMAHIWSDAGINNSYDENISERAPKYDFCCKQLKANSWLLFLLAYSLA